MARAKIYCEVTCCKCGGLAYKSGYYNNPSTIAVLKKQQKTGCGTMTSTGTFAQSVTKKSKKNEQINKGVK